MTLDDSRSPATIALESSRGKVEADQALAELEARLGGPVPAEQLRYWILGKAAPGEHEWHEESSDTPRLEQAGWTIDYSKFSSDAGARLPTVIKAASGGTRVRLVVDRWQLDR